MSFFSMTFREINVMPVYLSWKWPFSDVTDVVLCHAMGPEDHPR